MASALSDRIRSVRQNFTYSDPALAERRAVAYSQVAGAPTALPTQQKPVRVKKAPQEPKAVKSDIPGVKSMPSWIAKLNKTFPEVKAPDYTSGKKLGFKKAAALAEWAGDQVGVDVPGVTMAQVGKGEGVLRPGSSGVDPGGTKGWGIWAITSPFNDSLVKKYGGYEQMLNPVKNALAAAEVYKTQGLGAWYGTKFVTDSNAHYKGKLLGNRR